jgi:CHAT domain/Effector-associated domain 9
MKTLLILAANPLGTQDLRWDQELRAIDQELKCASKREQFQVKSAFAVRWPDLRRQLMEHRPEIVHFVGHGHGQSGLVMESEGGGGQAIPGDRLADLFSLVPEVRCVVMNACKTDRQGEAVFRHVPYVVSTYQSIGDQSAAQFAEGFYGGVFDGRDYVESFKWGKVAVSCSVSRFQYGLRSDPQKRSTMITPQNLEPELLSPDQIEKKNLQLEYADLNCKYQAVADQLKGTLNSDDQETLQHRLSSIKKKIEQIWNQLISMEKRS